MFGAFTSFGKLGSLARAIAAAWTPAALWPTGTEPGMWIDPSNLTSQWQDSAGTTQVSTPGTVADSSNPVGLALDLRLGATVLTDPGNHMFQATSTARPLLSARVNLLTYTEDFSNAAWLKYNASATASRITFSGTVGAVYRGGVTGGIHYTAMCEFQDSSTVLFPALVIGSTSSPSVFAVFDLAAGTVSQSESAGSGTVIHSTGLQALGSGWYRGIIEFTLGGSASNHNFKIEHAPTATGNTVDSFGEIVGNTPGEYLDARKAQLNFGPLVEYQAILTDGSSYSATGITPFQLYDGTDDGMATASFAAGTLTSSMDCMIAVKRDVSGDVILGLISADTGRYFGKIIGWTGGSTSVSCGTPTVLVDGAAITDTVVALDAALTVGNWHILEYRNLDLSAFTGVRYGGAEFGLGLNGAQGGILLFPSSTPTADRDAARTWLGAKVGLTL